MVTNALQKDGPSHLGVVREADDGRLGHLVVSHQCALDLRTAQPVARHVEHVCRSSEANKI